MEYKPAMAKRLSIKIKLLLRFMKEIEKTGYKIYLSEINDGEVLNLSIFDKDGEIVYDEDITDRV